MLERCERVRAETWGAFDVNVGADPRVVPREGLGPIDPSGLVKGWALDRAAVLLHDRGVHDFAVDAGGDVVVAGSAEDGRPWRVGIQHPWDRAHVACVVCLARGGVATSGRYERGDHIVDPRTGAPATGLMAVSVIADEVAQADGLATGLLVLGEDAPGWLEQHPDVAVLTIDDGRTVTTTPAFDRHVVTA